MKAVISGGEESKAAESSLTNSITYVLTTDQTDYLAGGFQYKNTVLQFFPHAEGYVNHEADGSNIYVFNYTDHLGNSRLSYSDGDGDGYPEIVEENNYYPFGLKQEGYNGPAVVYNLDGDGSSNSVPYKYKYNGKELQDELGLNMYAMDARMYDPAIGRWTIIDPVTHHDASTYAAFNNNPTYWVDPSGRDGEHYDWNSGGFVNSNGESISQAEAFAAYGLNEDGSEKDKGKKKGTSTKADVGRRRTVRQRSDNRGRTTSGSVFFDARGQELLSHWLNGTGENLELSSANWAEYMKANGTLSEEIEIALTDYLYGIREQLKKNGKTSVDFNFHGEIENGYFTGYEMLHGSHSKLGDTQIKGTVEYNSKTSQFDFNVQVIWNDRIDPNTSYKDDVMLTNFLNVFYSPQDYNVKIKWNEKVSFK